MRSTYMPTKYKTLIPYHTIGILLRFTIYYAIVPKALMRGCKGGCIH